MAIDVVVFDTSPAGLGRRKLPPAYAAVQVGLLSSWVLGAARMIACRRAVSIGASSWDTALPRIVEAARQRGSELRSIQVWGHGAPGRMLLGSDELTVASLRDGHRHAPLLAELRDRMAYDGQLWFRGCSVIAGRRGQFFADRFAEALGCAIVGHTYTIGFHQSGGHVIDVHMAAPLVYSEDEGIRTGTAGRPRSFLMSSADAPNTVTCFAAEPPHSWWRPAL